MTSLQAGFSYRGPIGEREASALSSIREVYGIWGLRFDEKHRRIVIDCDASRLDLGNLEFLLRNAGIRVQSSTSESTFVQPSLTRAKGA